MKIRIHSDLHLEFEDDGPISTHTTIPAMEGDRGMVLVLAGDITSNYRNARKHPGSDRYVPWMRDCLARFKAVVYVLGNHDLWNGGHWQDVYDFWTEMSKNFDNFHFLQRSTTVIDGVRFIGGTLWTDLSNPMDQLNAQAMNDFKYIKVHRGGDQWNKWSVQDWCREHNRMVHTLEEAIFRDEWDGKTVVVTHHAPTVQSIGEMFAGSPLNCCYYTNLERFMWHGDIDLWCHGHIHNSVDFVVGDEVMSTRVVCNPRGYVGDDLNPLYDPCKVVEI